MASPEQKPTVESILMRLTPAQVNERIELLKEIGPAVRSSFGARLVMKAGTDGQRLLVLRKRGLGGEKATYTDLAGAMMVDRSELTRLLESLDPGSVPEPKIAAESEWFLGDTGYPTRLKSSKRNEDIFEQWVNGYLMQKIVVNKETGREECDARVFGFLDLESQARYELIVEQLADWRATIQEEIGQELGSEVDIIRRKAEKFLSEMAQNRMPNTNRSTDTVLLSILRKELEKLIQNVEPKANFVPNNRVSGKTGERTHSLDSVGEVSISDVLMGQLIAKGWVANVTEEDLFSAEELRVTAPFLLISDEVLSTLADIAAQDEAEDISLPIEFGDTEEQAQAAIGSSVFLG